MKKKKKNTHLLAFLMIPYNLVKYPVLFLFHWEIYFNFSLNNVHDKSFWWEQHIRETCWLNIAANKSTRRGLHVGCLLTAEFDIPRAIHAETNSDSQPMEHPILRPFRRRQKSHCQHLKLGILFRRVTFCFTWQWLSDLSSQDNKHWIHHFSAYIWVFPCKNITLIISIF